MDKPGAQMQAKLVPIAPAPPGANSSNHSPSAAPPVMPFTCQTCAKRKVKCDKTAPACSSCRKGKLQCIYQEPTPRRRKRKPSSEIGERLAQYESILRRHGLLPQQEDDSPSIQETPSESRPPEWQGNTKPTTGRLLTSHGKSRYIDSHIWQDLGDDEIPDMSDEEVEHRAVESVTESISILDPLTDMFMDSQQGFARWHPGHSHAMVLWRTHIERVEPIFKILHIPSITAVVEAALKQPEAVSRANECLLFAVYHFAVVSMSEVECAQKLDKSRVRLLQGFQFATRQALVKAFFLRTTEMAVLQAFTLLLLSSRYVYDAQTYWILTGVAVRIAQRMGIHLDGEKLGLSPFDVQMRRRLFYQLLPLDGTASHMSGNSIGTVPDNWDTRQPLNIDDEQIWPGMTEIPKEKKGATQMIFPLARLSIGKCYLRIGKWTHGAAPPQAKDFEEADMIIDETENEVEEKFIRYCDVINPLHFLAMASARTGIIAMRLRTRLLKVKNQTATDEERRELFDISQKIIDADTATCTHAGLTKFQWHMKSFFLWGTWDGLIYLLTTLWKSEIISIVAVDAAWDRLEQVYKNHAEVLESQQALYRAFRNLTLKAWDANPPSSRAPEPSYIAMLRSRQNGKQKNVTKVDAVLPPDEIPAVGDLFGGTDLDTSSDFSLDAADWAFWEQLMHEHQQQGEFGE